MFRKMLRRTIDYIIEHRKTRAIIEDEIKRFMEDPKNKKMIKAVIERAIITYAKSTGYKM